MNKFWDLIKETMKGKSFYRVLFNWKVAEYCVDLDGVCVDLACGKKGASYRRYWDVSPGKLIRVDVDEKNKPDVVANLNDFLPFEDNFADNIFLFNAFYMIDQPEKLLSEIYRILKDDGRIFMTAQFIKSEESSVVDLHRYSSRKLQGMLKDTGFKKAEVYPIGRRFSALGNLCDFAWGNFFLFRFLKIFSRLFCLFLDKMSPKKLEKNYPCPIAWFVIAKK